MANKYRIKIVSHKGKLFYYPQVKSVLFWKYIIFPDRVNTESIVEDYSPYLAKTTLEEANEMIEHHKRLSSENDWSTTRYLYK